MAAGSSLFAEPRPHQLGLGLLWGYRPPPLMTFNARSLPFTKASSHLSAQSSGAVYKVSKLPVSDYIFYKLRTIRVFPRSPLQITLLLLRIHMPNDIIRQANDLIPSPVGHGRKAFRIGLVLEGIAGEIYTYIKTVRATQLLIRGNRRRGNIS